MSMICVAQGLAPDQIEILDMKPALLPDVVLIAEHDNLASEMQEEIRRLPREQQEWAKNNKERAAPPHEQERHQREAKTMAAARRRLAVLGTLEPPLGLGKMWHILHYALTDWEGLGGAGDFLFSGEPLDEHISAYGPARIYDPPDLADVNRALETIDFVDFQDNLNFEQMRRADVYSLSAGTRDPEYDATLRKDAGRSFLRLQSYLIKMAAKGNGLLIWIR